MVVEEEEEVWERRNGSLCTPSLRLLCEFTSQQAGAGTAACFALH